MKQMKTMLVLAAVFALFGSVRATTYYQPWERKYIVIDLSTGKIVEAYDNVPAGGWTYEYKTKKLVMRRIEPDSVKYKYTPPSTALGMSAKAEEWVEATVTEPFYIAVFELTCGQYQEVMGVDPMAEGRPSTLTTPELRPVGNVSYNSFLGTGGFINTVWKKAGLAFALPSGNQWAYACCAESTTAYYYGDTADGENMWYRKSAYPGGTNGVDFAYRMPVGTAPKEFESGGNGSGLYDMHGNIWEWTTDGDGSNHYVRGGAADCEAEYTTTGVSALISGDTVQANLGFRLIMMPWKDYKMAFVVTLDPKGGTCTDCTGYICGEGAALPTDAEKKDYTFGGWYTNESFSGAPVTEITANDVGDKTFWAKWMSEAVTVKDDKDNDTNVRVSEDWMTANQVSQAQLDETGANGIRKWQSYVLGLNPNDATSTTVVHPVQTSDAGNLTLNLGNLVTQTDAGVTVKYELDTKDSTGEWAMYGNRQDSQQFTFPLSDISGVKYFKIQAKFYKNN